MYTPQQNGRVECKHRHLLNVARTLRFQAALPLSFWGECVLTAAHIINRTPTPLLGGKTPCDLLYSRPPSYDMLRVFGCLCFASVFPRPSDKFAARGRRCIFVGYPLDQRGWRLYDLDTRQFFVSRDVTFYESVFPFADPPTPSPASAPDVPSPAQFDDVIPSLTQSDVRGSDISLSTDSVPSAVVESAGAPQVSISPPAASELPSVDPPATRSSIRARQPNVRLTDYVCTATQSISPSPGTPYSLSSVLSVDRFSPRHIGFIAALQTHVEPSSYSEAAKHSHWQQAMQAEIDALQRNHTWDITHLPSGKRPIGCKWVYRIKYHADGSVERYKARLVVLGNRHIEGTDYTETFAPVAKMSSVRIFLSVAAIRGYELHQMDVHNAFLHGDLTEEVYMKPPPGLPGVTDAQVCRLRKSLYGLRQAPRNWFAKLAQALRVFGFVQSGADYSLFTMQRPGFILHVLVYVDDLIISGNDSAAISRFKSYLSSCFHMKDLGSLKYFLGIEIARSASGLYLCQRKYALDILSEAGLLGAKPAEFPMEQNHSLATIDSPTYSDPERYRRLVGRLIYLTITRPELCYSVHTLAQFMQAPKEAHWNAALRVLHYIKAHPGQGLLLSASSSLAVTAYCDSDWAACPITRRSLTGYFIMLGSSPISWKTKKQVTVSRSSAEAEYRSMAAACSELLWIRSLLTSLGVTMPSPMRLFCDSKAALHIAANPVFHERTKHIEIDLHFVRDIIQAGVVSTAHISTTDQPADLFTKALGRQQFQFLLGKLGICDLHAPT